MGEHRGGGTRGGEEMKIRTAGEQRLRRNVSADKKEWNKLDEKPFLLFSFI